MRFFRRRSRKPEERAVTQLDWISGNDPSPQVTEGRALSLVPVFAAIRHIVDYGSTLPVDFHRKDGNRRVPMDTPPMLFQNLIDAGRLEPWLSQLFYSLVARGSAVGFAERNDAGSLIGVTWLPMDSVTVDDRNIRNPVWRVGGQVISNPARDLVHVPWVTVPGRTLGLSPLEAFAATVNAGLSAQEYADVKRGGGVPPAHLKNTMLTLDAEAAAKVQARAVKSFASGKPFVSGMDWDLSILSIPPNQAQFVETWKLTANQVASVYGLDPTEVGGEAGNSQEYVTEELRQIRRAYDMQPYLVRVERALSALFPLRQNMKFNVDSKIRADLKSRWEVNKLRVEMGAASINEIRAQEDERPIPGGDKYRDPNKLPAPPAPAQPTDSAPTEENE